MSLKGHLGTIALPELLQWLAIGQKTGTLVLVRDDGVHRIVVDDGRIISTSTSDRRMQLGRWLLDAGLVDEPIIARARKLQEATGMSLGRVLLTLQAVDEDELRQALRNKAEALVSALFHSSNASFHFVEDDLGDPGVALSLDATQLVLSAAHSLEEVPADEPEEGPAPAAVKATAKENPPPPIRATPTKTTATVIETLPERSEPGGRWRSVDAAATHEPKSEPNGRRAVGGLAAAAALIVALVAVLVVGRSHVPAKAEESADLAAQVVGDLAPLAAGDLAASGVAADLAEPEVDPVELAFPTEVPAAVSSREEYLANLLAQRDAELADLRRRLRATESAPGLEAGGVPEVPTGESLAAPEPSSEARLSETTSEPAADLPIEPSGPAPAVSFPAEEIAAAAAPELPALEPVRVPEAVPPTPARLLSRPAPDYPPAAERMGRSARITVRVLVGESGRVLEAEATGSRIGLGFEAAALKAARRSSWQPATENGVPVRSWVELRFEFGT